MHPWFAGMNCNYIDITGNLPTSSKRKKAFCVKGFYLPTLPPSIPNYGTPVSEVMKKCILM